jgi:DNA-binding response OmpR family regulator
MNGKRNSPGALMGDSSLSHGSEYRPHVLVVDDESMIADTVTKILSLSGYAATAAYDGEDAIESALLVPPQLMITDVMLPGMNGIELAITMKRIYPECKILLFSGQASTADLMSSAKGAGHHFTLLSKPMPPQDLLAAVAKHLQQNDGSQNEAVA